MAQDKPEKKTGFGKKFLDAVWKDPNAGQESEAAVETTTPAFTAPPVTSTVVQGTHRPEFENYFREVREKADLPGPDYKEFAQTVEESKVDETDESKRVKSAFKAFKSMGVTKDKLIETANHYKKLFAEKKITFDESVNNEIRVGVGSMQAEVETLKQKNIDIDKQIQNLIADKAKNDERVIALSNDINTRSATLNAKKNDFNVTYDSMIAEIDHNVLLINQHIQ